MERSAEFSRCRKWRYTLERYWDRSIPPALFILLNPSTADESQDDPTNRRGIQYAQDLGWGGCVFVNLFAYRTPYPKELKSATDIKGPENDAHIVDQCNKAGIIIAAWGTHGVLCGRSLEVKWLLRDFNLWCMKLTQRHEPAHILYLPRDLKPQPWNPLGNDPIDKRRPYYHTSRSLPCPDASMTPK